MSKSIHHILVWVGIYVAYTIMLSFHGDPVSMMLLNFYQVSMYVVAYYLLRYIQIPYLYDQKKFGLFALSLILSSVFVYMLYRGCVIYFLDGVRGFSKQLHYEPMADYLVKVIRFYSPAMALLALESHFKGKKEKERILQLEKEKLSNELKYLKAQINPNFLFNTLNNLYAHVRNESPKAPDMIMKLSGILDYVLYQSQHTSVQLSKEVETIENFIELEQIRYGNNLNIGFNSGGDLSVPISPLVLMAIVENAFKQESMSITKASKIDIQVLEKNKTIHFKIVSVKNEGLENIIRSKNNTDDILAIKRQLDLVYPEQHDLAIADLDDSFNVTLTINSN